MPHQHERRIRGPGTAETARLVSSVLLPTLARGAVVRRPLWEGLADRAGVDRSIVSTLREFRECHGDDPLPLRFAGRDWALVLDPGDARQLLRQTPDPFSPGGREKGGALCHFQPHGALISDHDRRPGRREASTDALAFGRVVHPNGDVIAQQADAEARALVTALRNAGPQGPVLTWTRFAETFDALARRVFFGPFAARDRRTTELLYKLRQRANWSYLAPVDRTSRERFLDRLHENILRAEPGSLAAGLPAGPAAQGPTTQRRAVGRVADVAAQEPGLHPESQAAHWLFAFDAAAIATYRALALLTARGPETEEAREEARTREGLDLPLLRATLRESVRLWPTTLVVIREGTRKTFWRQGVIEEGTTFMVMSSYFHRDTARLPYADAFAPRIWIDGRAEREPGILPFSYGPAGCPATDLVPFTASLFLRSLLRAGRPHRADRGDPLRAYDLPASLNHFALRFSFSQGFQDER